MFEFTIPPESAPRSARSLTLSVMAHALAILLLFSIRFSGIAQLPEARNHFTLLAPLKPTPLAPPKIKIPRPRPFRPAPPLAAHLTVPIAQLIPAPAIEIPKSTLPEMPKTIPTPVIIPSTFGEARAAAPLPAPKPVVKAAGFESSEQSATGPKRGELTSVGSFESAHSAAGAPPRSATARAGGFSDASGASPSDVRKTQVLRAGFGDTTVANSAPLVRQTVLSRATSVEIISKPKPAYTAEARANKIEGEVLLDVQFSASGAVRVLRVVRGLGGGLDETAIAAAQGIRFRPETRNGESIDSVAVVHILFQLAN
jgi:TonB family protein